MQSIEAEQRFEVLWARSIATRLQTNREDEHDLTVVYT